MDWSFDGIKTYLKDKLSAMSNWTNTLYYGVYERLIDLIAYIIEKLLYVVQVYYRESSWTQSQKIEFIAQECELLGYKYHRKIGAIGNIIISADPTFSSSFINPLNDVPIPRWSLFTNTDKTENVYCTDATIYYKGTVGNQTVPVKEGIPKSYLYIAQGVTNETIYLYPADVIYGIDNDEVDIFISNASGEELYEVTVVDNLYFIEDTVNYYCTVKNVPDFSSVNITFGDGISTPKLNAGMYILIRYAETLGDQGNIQSTNIIRNIDSTIYDVGDTDVTSLLYVNNIESISDGSDFESIESIRNKAPALFESGFRAGSKTDWASIINTVPYIYKSRAWSAEDVGGSALIPDQNTVFVTAVTNSGDDLTVAQHTDIEVNYLKPVKSPTETITWEALEKVYGFFNVNAKLNSSSSNIVEADIKEVLNTEYSVLNVDFQTNIYESAYIGVIDSVSNIVYHNTTLDHMEKNVAKTAANETIIPSNLPVDTSILADQVLLVNNTLRIWEKEKIAGMWGAVRQIGYEASGLIYSSMPSSFTISATNVNFLTNQYSYIITGVGGSGVIETGTRNPGDADPNGYLLYLTYQTKDGNGVNQNCIRLPRRNQITDIDEDFIFTTLSFI